ncbi:hypothetical protein FISHEDRAFT_14151, partial [Fistulina hepatica ATCC 64428]
ISAWALAHPLEAHDLPKLQDNRSAAYIVDVITKSYARRHVEADDYNACLASGEIKLSTRQRIWWTL